MGVDNQTGLEIEHLYKTRAVRNNSEVLNLEILYLEVKDAKIVSPEPCLLLEAEYLMEKEFR
jgi:hypothetical protein